MNEVKHYLSRSIVSIGPDAIATLAATLMRDKNIGSLLVKEGDKYIGIVTEGDLARRVMAMEKNPLETSVRDVMTQPLLTIDGEALMASAFLKMSQNKVRHLAVMSGEEVVGVLSIRDFVHYYKKKFADCRKEKKPKGK